MSKKKDSKALNPERLSNLEYLREVWSNFCAFDQDADIEAVYTYAQMVYRGDERVEVEDPEYFKMMFACVFIYLYRHGLGFWEFPGWEEGTEENEIAHKYQDMFLGAEALIKEDYPGPNKYPYCFAQIIQKGIPGVLKPDPERAFRIVQGMLVPDGILGGIELLDTIHFQDQRKLFIGDCYMNGNGVQKNLNSALHWYTAYHTDHLAQKHQEDMIENRFYELYEKLTDAVEKEKIQDKSILSGYLLSLAEMTMEGLGCEASPQKAAEYRDKADALMKTMAGEKVDDRLDREYLDRLLSWNPKPYEENMELKVGDHIILDKYNNRSVFWKVLHIENGQALIFCDEVLESSYMHSQRSYDTDTDWAAAGISFLLSSCEANTADDYYCLKEKPIYKPVFLTKEQVEKYLPNPEDRICCYRSQALINSTDDEERGNHTPAPWWLLSEGEEDEETHTYVDEDGNLDTEESYCDKGIRPAMLISTASKGIS